MRQEQAPGPLTCLMHSGGKTEPSYNRSTGCSPAGDPVLSGPYRPRILGQAPVGDNLPGRSEVSLYVPGIADLLP